MYFRIFWALIYIEIIVDFNDTAETQTWPSADKLGDLSRPTLVFSTSSVVFSLKIMKKLEAVGMFRIHLSCHRNNFPKLRLTEDNL